MQELANMHALKKEKGIIPVSQVQPLILDSIKKNMTFWNNGTNLNHLS